MKKNILANLVGKFWSILSGFLFIPLYIYYLGFDSYSIISFTLVIAGIMAVLDGGLTATLAREFARTDNSDRQKKRIFLTLETSYYIVVFICIAIIFLASPLIANSWLNIKSFEPDAVSSFIKIISFDIGFQLLLRFYIGGLLGLEKQVKANILLIGWGIMRNGLIVFIIMLAPDLKLFFCWQAVSTIIFTVLLKLVLEKELSNKFAFNLRFKIERSIFNKVSHFAGGMMLISLVAALNTQLDKLTISKMLSLESLGYYTLAISLAQALVVIITPISTALLPRFTSQYADKKNKEAALLFNKSALLISILVFVVFAILSFFAKEIVWVWTGKIEIAKKTYSLVPVISLAYAMLALQLLPFNIAIANGYTKLNNILGLTSLLITIPGYWLLTKRLGAMGAASLFCAVQIITTFIYIYYINKKFLKLNIFHDVYLKHILRPISVALILVFLISKLPDFFMGSRILTFIRIFMFFIITLIASSAILLPLKELKSLIKIKI